MEDIWPPLPIVVYGFDYITLNADTIVAALEHKDRVHQIKLDRCPSFLFQQVSPVIQKPFPVLTDLSLGFNSGMVPIVPDSFLGGSAPGLRSLSLKGIPFPFPGLRKLLLSAADLVEVRLWRIPYEEYISPWEIATCLSALTRLEEFHLGFGFDDRRLLDDDSRLPPPPTRYALPALTSLKIEVAIDYLEDLISRIETPIREHLSMVFSPQLRLDTLQLTKFIDRTPKLKPIHINIHL